MTVRKKPAADGFPIEPPIEPMLAKLATELPAGDGCLFEPKWDGFRAIVYKGTADLYIQSRDLKPFDRYFPELHDALLAMLPQDFGRWPVTARENITLGQGPQDEATITAAAQAADACGAPVVTDMAHIAGLVAAGVHPSPIPYSDFVTTTTHKTLRGPRGGMVLCTAAHAAALDKTVMPGVQGGPLMHVIAAKAVAFREALRPEFRAYQEQTLRNAVALANALAARGYRLVSGGTDTHLMLVDLSPRGITGKDAQEALDRAWITVNKNTIPYDTRSPMVTSGIRIGTPAVTTRGLREPEMEEIARLIDRVLGQLGQAAVEAAVRAEVQELTGRFPLYTERRA